MKENEVWVDIEGYDGLYQVSDLGRVKSLEKSWVCGSHNTVKTKKESILKEMIGTDGYPSVNLWKNGSNKKGVIHRIVALSFIPNPENKREVNHKNGVKTDNRLENLEWVTPSENIRHAFRTGLQNKWKKGEGRDYWLRGLNHHMYGRKGGLHSSSKKVICENTGKIWGSIVECSSDLGIHRTTLSKILNGHIVTNVKVKYYVNNSALHVVTAKGDTVKLDVSKLNQNGN